jgi:hypothetical protein
MMGRDKPPQRSLFYTGIIWTKDSAVTTCCAKYPGELIPTSYMERLRVTVTTAMFR